jgi:two-component system chemotaxis response regulator CheY
MKIRALVADDSRVMRNMVMQTLRQTALGEFEFTEAEDGADALGKFNPRSIDLVFVDWNMPKMTGMEFVRKVRVAGHTVRTPIVMVTSERSVGKIEDALASGGADVYITKPFTVDGLKRQIEPIVEKLASERAAAAAAPRSGGFFSKLLGN